jgi:hypothetical protein
LRADQPRAGKREIRLRIEHPLLLQPTNATKACAR